MAMSAPASEDDDGPITDINTTPLVDVMLVLLIIFLITIPVVVQTVPVALPKVTYKATVTKPENVALSVRGAPDGSGRCEVYWGMDPVNSKQLLDKAVAKLELEVKKLGGPGNVTPENMPEAHIRGDVNTPYKCIGGAIYTMQSAGFARVGFISEPPAGTVTTRN